MPKIEPFENFNDEYDEWFIKNRLLYKFEIDAVRNFIPLNSFGLDIGAGSGKFSLPFGISTGIDPSFKMALKSMENGIKISIAVAEALPFKNKVFDFALMVTSICFLDDIRKAFDEAYRVLKSDGYIVIGFVDSESKLGRKYILKKNESRFYRDAEFYSPSEIIHHLEQSGFTNFEFNQTIFSREDLDKQIFKKGYGEGSFVVIKAVKRNG